MCDSLAMPEAVQVIGDNAKCFAGMPNNRSQFELIQVKAFTTLDGDNCGNEHLQITDCTRD
jgi:hypothetical protein